MGRLVLPTLMVVMLTATSCASASVRADVPAPPGSASVSSAPARTSGLAVAPAVTAVPRTQTITSGLNVPWGLAFLPDGTALVTLRDRAEVRRVSSSAPAVSVGRVAGVIGGRGEGGLLGIAVSPRFATDRAVFVYFTSAVDNRVMRMTFNGRVLSAGPVIVKGIPSANNHNGGRLAFGPDGYLYISTGDAGNPASSQNKASLGGKILRVTNTGAPAPRNPFPGSRVWSLGHRNVQGLAWNSSRVMYASEFGQNTWDELNRILPGRNYGWPVVEGISQRAGYVSPIRQWPTSAASPSGIAVGADGAVYMAALRGESLWRIPLDSTGRALAPRRLLQGTYGRLRAVVAARDGRLWILTNNTARGNPRPTDDRVIALRLPIQ